MPPLGPDGRQGAEGCLGCGTGPALHLAGWLGACPHPGVYERSDFTESETLLPRQGAALGLPPHLA